LWSKGKIARVAIAMMATAAMMISTFLALGWIAIFTVDLFESVKAKHWRLGEKR
jgi:hypothetical protein